MRGGVSQVSLANGDLVPQIAVVADVGTVSVPVNTEVATSTTSAQLIAAASGLNERTTVIYNDSSSKLRLGFGEAAAAGKGYVPAGGSITTGYMGVINGKLDSGTGAASVIAEGK